MSATRERIWNQFDEMGLLVGIIRVPGETNEELRNRILNRPQYDSTRQGVLNYVTDALLSTRYQAVPKTIFASLRLPLSYASYQSIVDKTMTYYSPRVISDGVEYVITSGSSTDRDDSALLSGIQWTLWKQPDGSYDQIWTTTQEPRGNIELKYMWVNEGGSLYIIRETATLRTWEEGRIVERDPDE